MFKQRDACGDAMLCDEDGSAGAGPSRTALLDTTYVIVYTFVSYSVMLLFNFR